MTMKVLACDGIHEDGLSLFRDAGWDVDVAPAPLKDPAALAAALDGVDALLVRSATPVTADALAGGNRLHAEALRPDGPCRDRTYDLEIKSLLLYQLS